MADDDWRQTDQADYLGGRTFRWSVWTPARPADDHDHCEFCWAEFGQTPDGHVDFNEGWVTTEGRRQWVCDECFTDFAARLHLVPERRTDGGRR